MRMFKKVAIVGTGLIGGSIALAIRKKRLAQEVVGVSRKKKNVLLAKRIGAIDRGSLDLKIIQGADLVILALPVGAILKLAPEVARLVEKDCLVSDVGSTKAEIVSSLSKIFPNFVGAHPLAGSEKTSITQARHDMFEGSVCILTPVAGTRRGALNKIKSLWKSLGARTETLTPSTHDKILSFVSHLPHAVAFSLIGSVPKEYLKFAASGLKDTTRISASDSALWLDIWFSNRKNMLESIKFFQGYLSRISAALRSRDRKRLSGLLEQAGAKRRIIE